MPANPMLFLAPLSGSLAYQSKSGAGTLTGSGAVRYFPAPGSITNLWSDPLMASAVAITADGCTISVDTTTNPSGMPGLTCLKMVATATGVSNLYLGFFYT